MAPKAKAKKGPLVSQQPDNRLLSQSNTTQQPSSLQPHSTAEGGAKESTINLSSGSESKDDEQSTSSTPTQQKRGKSLQAPAKTPQRCHPKKPLPPELH
jgi:hypothetical protein